MNTVTIITKKRDGKRLTKDEIEYLVKGYTEGTIPDYQMSAFLMAVYFSGMDREETIALTQCMKESGDVVDLSKICGVKVDKHSTGGVGDKTTLIVGPVAAACGVPVAKMSGRGLGFTGGTVDKLEAIPGFQTAMAEADFISQVNNEGIAVIGQTGDIAPADKKIYALRDVTATVENLSLITSSIMSKKLAAGSDAILLDVKCGSGAFMKTEEDARQLAELMVDIGEGSGKKTMAMITDMSQPLGCAVGNALEVMEAIDVLKGGGPEDIRVLSIALAGAMIYLGGKAKDPEEGKALAEQAIANGRALEKFKIFVAGQGGDPEITEDYGLLPQSKIRMPFLAREEGYIQSIDAMTIGLASQHTGAGRETKQDEIDLSAGIVLHKKAGDQVKKGDAVCTIYGSDVKKTEKALEEIQNAVKIGLERPELPALIKTIIER
ncbi:MAG: pyrimidine-nucleoside phosphorylase [Bacillota bacterium]|nr:pyrimidine-nucleoside phosphorylase [Bacillota bacterium]